MSTTTNERLMTAVLAALQDGQMTKTAVYKSIPGIHEALFGDKFVPDNDDSACAAMWKDVVDTKMRAAGLLSQVILGGVEGYCITEEGTKLFSLKLDHIAENRKLQQEIRTKQKALFKVTGKKAKTKPKLPATTTEHKLAEETKEVKPDVVAKVKKTAPKKDKINEKQTEFAFTGNADSTVMSPKVAEHKAAALPEFFKKNGSSCYAVTIQLVWPLLHLLRDKGELPLVARKSKVPGFVDPRDLLIDNIRVEDQVLYRRKLTRQQVPEGFKKLVTNSYSKISLAVSVLQALGLVSKETHIVEGKKREMIIGDKDLLTRFLCSTNQEEQKQVFDWLHQVVNHKKEIAAIKAETKTLLGVLGKAAIAAEAINK